MITVQGDESKMKRRGGVTRLGTLRGDELSFMLEDQLQSQLHGSRIKGLSDLTELGISDVIVDAASRIGLELSVIESVETLRSEFQSAATLFAEDEALEQRYVPVITTRSTG